MSAGYLLDTNACIALINGQPVRVRERLEGVLTEGPVVAVPAVAAFELWFGVAKKDPHRRRGTGRWSRPSSPGRSR